MGSRLHLLRALLVGVALVSCSAGGGTEGHILTSAADVSMIASYDADTRPLRLSVSVTMQSGTGTVEVVAPDGEPRVTFEVSASAPTTRTDELESAPGKWTVRFRATGPAEGSYSIDWRQ